MQKQVKKRIRHHLNANWVLMKNYTDSVCSGLLT